MNSTKNSTQTISLMDCQTCRSTLPELLMDSGLLPESPVSVHLASCAACHTEFQELRATFALLDEWTAPEPSPYFEARVRAHVREAAQASPEGLWERLASTLRFSTGRSLRPAMAGALALILILGGGTAVTVLEQHQAPATPAAASPAVNDLRIFDNNAQAFQQMDLLDESTSDGGSAPPQS